jgi:threonine 3-dehydrogenase
VADSFLGVTKMAAGRGALSLEQHPGRPPGPGEVALRVAAAGMCGTDLAVYDWAPPIAAVMADHLPVVVGHEFSGTVDAVGPGVDPALEGARVAIESHRPCGACRACRAGKGHVCANLEYVGFSFDGGFAERAVVPVELVRPVPDAIDEVTAAILEPFALAARAADEGAGCAGQAVLITGCGALGIMTALVATARGARSLVLAETDPVRRTLAARLVESDAVVDPAVADVVAAVADATAGEGADVWIDYSGAQSALDAGLAALTNGGEARTLGIYAPRVTLDLTRMVLREISLRPIHGRLLERSWSNAIELLADRRIDLAPVVTAQFDLADFEAAFSAARERDGLKVVLRP